jgi:hypothetical protein
MSEDPAIYRIDREINDAREKSTAIDAEINDIANEHEFNWWWYKTGANMEPIEGEGPDEFVNRLTRASYMHARGLPDLPPCSVPELDSPPVAGMFGIFAIGVVVGVIIAIATAMIIF